MIKLIRNKKAQADIRIMAAALIIVIVTLFILFYSTNNDINFGVSLIDSDIEEGTDAMLHYEIRNGWFSGLKEDVQFKYYIIDQTEEEVVPIGDMPRGESRDNYVYLDASDLDAGSYSVWTILWYKIDGIVHTKELGLSLTIY